MQERLIKAMQRVKVTASFPSYQASITGCLSKLWRRRTGERKATREISVEEGFTNEHLSFELEVGLLSGK